MQNAAADPHLTIQSPSGKYHVRTGQGKLYLYNARSAVEAYAELGAGEIIAQLERDTVTFPPFSMQQGAEVPTVPAPTPSAAPHRGIAAAILVAGVALNGYTLYTAFYTDSVNEKPAVTLVLDANEAATRAREFAGTFATGDHPGDRLIEVKADGHVKFVEIGNKSGLGNSADTYQLGRHGTKFCLTTPESGVIDVQNLDTLVYYRDTYRRTGDR
jgi:hypothetical protein